MILDNLYLNESLDYETSSLSESLGFTETEIFNEDVCFMLEDMGVLNEETNLMTPLTLVKEAYTGNSKKRLKQLENSYKTMETRGDKKRLLGRIRRSIAVADTALDQSFIGQVRKVFGGTNLPSAAGAGIGAGITASAATKAFGYGTKAAIKNGLSIGLKSAHQAAGGTVALAVTAASSAAKLFLQNNKKCIAATKEYRTKLLELEKKVLAKKVDGETKDNLVESFDILDLF